ncbi:uncharacterized protein B0I36DRAFT_436433 [Microdochium trichocladiopsis]|uniref:Nucleoside phosphorylase domain-containing protein n=1 Tax=Microdochium trichocladiopsis TaxID=1682393 RepID=A0A9P8XS21_9PEZI|nr:uncharacterized protein B0I36DRAFT_436433 [Microdochium trichocladiopsis]KAH7014465.1 hypothetical protein B0I36DRAFT_436433 [Microdochium trichocladiopsis]
MVSLSTHVYATRPNNLAIECDIYSLRSPRRPDPAIATGSTDTLEHGQAAPPETVFLYFHAGGLVNGSRDRLPPWLVQACVVERGWHLMSADYRMLPQVGGRELLEDAMAAYQFARSWSSFGSFDVPSAAPRRENRVVAGGGSAGFFLATLLAHHASAYSVPPPAALLSLTGIITHRHDFFNSSVQLFPREITHEEVAPFFAEPVQVGSMTRGHKVYFCPDMLEAETGLRNRAYKAPEAPSAPLGDNSSGAADPEVGRGELYDYLLFNNRYLDLIGRDIDVGFAWADPKNGTTRDEKLAAWPPTIIIAADADTDVSPAVTTDITALLGPSKAQVFTAQGMWHLFMADWFLDDFDRLASGETEGGTSTSTMISLKLGRSPSWATAVNALVNNTKMTTRSRTHGIYTVGWVCALPKEQTAATAMLDERHPDLPKPNSDPNSYTLGSISGHNIVIACLPKGKIGTSSAAKVSSHLISTFPAIRFGLMVGIGGGVPPKVRLGDVAVSVPADQHPGVVQWDMGKAEQGGTFRRTGVLNNPPTLLLATLTKLETAHELEGSKIPQYLQELQERYPRLAAKYLRSDSMQDVLFKASYNHEVKQGRGGANKGEDEEEAESDAEETCQNCDVAQILKRTPREMRVHYGLIASGNQVIKDAWFRDELVKGLGKVLCIEMEAAGLMDSFPCLVIRGICDYADSHKNKVWQEHAAAVAAAFAKELLSYVMVDDVQGEKPIKAILSDQYAVSENVTSIREETSRNTRILHKRQDMEILDWLSTHHYGPQQSDTLQRWHPKTGQWFLSSAIYQDWLRTGSRTLYCPGNPGAGKTVMASAAIRDIDHRFSTDANIGLAYIYFTFSRQRDQTVEHVLASLLVQFLRQKVTLPDHIRDLSERHQKKGTLPTHDDLMQAFHRVVSAFHRVYIVLDALDECAAESQRRAKIMTDLSEIQARADVNILATSRINGDIASLVTRQNTATLPIVTQDQDMVNMLRDRLGAFDRQLYSDDFADLVVTKVARASRDMFLLADLHVNALAALPTKGDVLDALDKIDQGSDRLHTVYETAMGRIQSQGSGLAQLAKKTLLWVVHGRRQMTSTEVRHALAIRPNTKAIDTNYCPSIKRVTSICAGLVIVDKESDTVRLVHYTTQEYFEKMGQKWFTDAQEEIANSCITYLSYEVFSSYCETREDLQRRLVAYPFYSYAACEWSHHAGAACDGPAAIELLKDQRQVEASWQARLSTNGIHHDFRDGKYIANNINGLHLASILGLSAAVRRLLGIYEADCRDSLGRTPLLFAAVSRHTEVVKLLLKTNQVDVDAKDTYGQTPLVLVAGLGYTEVARLLLEIGQADVNHRHGLSERTPLSIAAVNGHTEVVKLLLESGQADINTEDHWDSTPLLLAADNNHTEVVKLLVEAKQCNIDNNDKDGRIPLSRAAEIEHIEVVKLLLEARQVDFEPENLGECEEQLLWMAGHGNRNVVMLLLEAMLLDNEAKDDHGQTPR